ncbi:hypothetical protein FDZ84_13290 [Saccharopolyspora sp. ASAGF58]|nr:hypothetical protein FDZ84_13290 [Saccharopolyspora sp. ASAGF58]
MRTYTKPAEQVGDVVTAFRRDPGDSATAETQVNQEASSVHLVEVHHVREVGEHCRIDLGEERGGHGVVIQRPFRGFW